jgi:hypothetical protein
VCASTIQAHHSISLFDVSTPIWVKGTVIAYEPIAPHAMIYLEEATADGHIQRWRIEGPFPGRLNRILDSRGIGDGKNFFAAGDVIEVCGFDVRAELKRQRAADAPEPEARFAHGIVIVMPSGRMQSWGPYGKMDNCVRPHDTTATWREFLNADPLARDLWCAGRRNVRAATITSREFMDEVSHLIDKRCE